MSLKAATKAIIRRALAIFGYRVIRDDHPQKRLGRIASAASINISQIPPTRQLWPITDDNDWRGAGADIASLAAYISSSVVFQKVVVPYFADYPKNSFISAYSRAYLYSVVRASKPALVVEVGTHYGGTSEVLARALWENGFGAVHTIDPFGAERAPPVLAGWPHELSAITTYQAINSMSFFARARDNNQKFDLVLVDGDHDLEFALFDIQMAAKQLRPGGLIFVDNFEQVGPFHAAKRFAAANPTWTVLGSPLSDYRPDAPFAKDGRSSLPETSLIALQAPLDVAIGAEPRSWGQATLDGSSVTGFAIDVALVDCGGVLNYRAILRAFGDQSSRIEEFKAVGKAEIPADTSGERRFAFDRPLKSEFALMFSDSHHTIELELSWDSPGTFKLKGAPQPLGSAIKTFL
jgi:predicted O-methyltransferase YrrM